MAYSSTTLGTLRSRIRERLLAQFWADAELNAYIIETLRIWNVLTGYTRSRQTKTISSGSVPFYSKNSFTDTGILLLRIETSSTQLDTATLSDLGTLSPTWMTDTAAAPSYWLHVGHNIVAVTPIPTQSFSATTYYVDTMTVPAADGDYIQVGDEDLSAIIDCVTFIGRLKEGGKEAQEAVPLLQNFIKQAAKYNSKLQFSSIYKRILGLPQQRQQRPDLLDTPNPR